MDFISNFNGLELVFIIILAILLFGPEKIPEIAAKLGSWARTLRNLSSQVMEDLREETGLSEINGVGDPLSSTLDQTVADLKSTVESIQSPVQSIIKTLNEGLESPSKPEQTSPDGERETSVEDSAVAKKELLEKHLQELELQLQEIRKELDQTESETSEGMNV